MPTKLVSIHRPLMDPEFFRPVTDEVRRRFGHIAITPFTGANVFMNLAKRSDLAQVPEWPDDDPKDFHQLLRSVLPPSFGKAPLTAKVERIREIMMGAAWILFAQFTPNRDLIAEHNKVVDILRGLDISIRTNQPFRFQVGVGMVYEEFTENYIERLYRETPKIAAFEAGKILTNHVTHSSGQA